jgi:hypothetical protein
MLQDLIVMSPHANALNLKQINFKKFGTSTKLSLETP